MIYWYDNTFYNWKWNQDGLQKDIMLLIGMNQGDSETYLLISTIISGYVLANG